MKQGIHTFVAKCDTCQRNKGESVKRPGTLQPLLLPPTIWMDISMEFIVGLLESGNKSIFMVVVDHLSKYAHFCALQHSFTTSTMAQFLWIIFSNSMACLILLFLTMIPLLPGISGNNYQAPGNPIASQHNLSSLD
jgi:hypothetical protein